MSSDAALAAANFSLNTSLAARDQAARARFLFVQARRAAQFGVSRSVEVARSGRSAVATAAVRAGASGFTAEGSATDVIARLAQEAETGRQRALYEGFRESDDLRHQARIQKSSARFNRILATASGGLGGFLLSGGSF